jgi:hypothetical protein
MLHQLTNAQSNIEGFLALGELAAETESLGEDSLEVSFASLPAFDAQMAAPLGVVLSRITDRDNKVFIVDVPWGQLEMLSRNRFLADFGHEGSTEMSATALPYARFATTDGPQFYDYLDAHLPGKGLPEMTSEFSLLLLQSLGEVFVNAETHSESRLGVFICGQFHPVHQRLYISLADAGITIPERVNRCFNSHLHPLQALRWVLTKGHTTKEATPGGLGLKQLHEFVVRNEGAVQIASGKAFWQFAAGIGQFQELTHAFPGTVVSIEVNTARWELLPRPGATTSISKSNLI